MPVTQKDVARVAGVSVSTVSRVIRNTNYINAATKEKVLDAVQKLQYRPDTAARRLKYGRTYTIGFVVNDIANPFFGHAVIGAERYISEASGPEFELFLVNTSGDPKKEIRAIEVMLSKRVEGIILASTATQECIDAVRNAAIVHQIPVVSIDNQLGGFELGIVSADNKSGAYQLTHHLLQHGHQRIGIISGPREESHACARVEGCKQALAESGLKLDEQLVPFQSDFDKRILGKKAESIYQNQIEKVLVGVGNWSPEDGYRIVYGWLNLATPPTAIFSSNNFMCIGALSAIREHKLHVPGDIAIVSFDDIQFGNLLRPCLTTLDYDWQRIGGEAARLLLEGVGPKGRSEEPTRIRVPVELLVRESCGCNWQPEL